MILCLNVAVPIPCWAGKQNVLVILSDSSAPYQSFAKTLNKNLPPLVQTSVLEYSEQLLHEMPQANLIVAVGMKATELVAAQTSIPVLAVMIPRMSYEKLRAQTCRNRITCLESAIYIDQPLVRQIDFLRAAFPDRRRVGLLNSLDVLDVTDIRQDLAKRGGSLVVETVLSANDLFPRLKSVLTNSDILLAIPDSMIYNSSNIRNILLTSYRYGVPLIGLSQAYVNAGALCGIFSTPEQLAVQAGVVVNIFERTGQLPEPQYPADFNIAINQQVAHSLEIAVPAPETIRMRMDSANGE